MNRDATMQRDAGSTPHLRRLTLGQLLMGLVLVMWNGFGLALAVSVQTGHISNLDPVSEQYFESQPLWFVLFTDLAPLCGLAGAVALLLQHRLAVKLFAAQFTILAIATTYELIIGRSLLQISDMPVSATLVSFTLLAAQFFYARWLEGRGRLY